MTSSADRRGSTLGWLVDHPTFVVQRWLRVQNDLAIHDVRHRYVEQFWLPVLGPSSVLALRRFADLLDAQPAEIEVELVELGACLGIGTGTGRNTQINRNLSLKRPRFSAALIRGAALG